MEVLFRRQQKRGGIIDVEAEKNKFLIETRVCMLPYVVFYLVILLVYSNINP